MACTCRYFYYSTKIAIQQETLIFGESTTADLCGQFSMSDFPEMNYRERTEHAGRGFDWNFFERLDGLTSGDLEPWKYPSDEEVFQVDYAFTGHYILGNLTTISTVVENMALKMG